MGKAHNKKRNVGIIYEQLLGYISESIVDKDAEKTKRVIGILKAHFTPGTQLYKEFRLFNAMVRTTVGSEALALRILSEARRAAVNHDPHTLQKEKSALIRDINKKLDDPKFYRKRIDEYRTYATIQTLLNDWRSDGSPNFERICEYEQKVCGWLLKEKTQTNLDELKDERVNRLAVKIMTEKFNKKYQNILTDEQSDLVREYALSSHSGNTDKFRNYLENLKATTTDSLDNYLSEEKNRILSEKASVVRENVMSITTSDIDDLKISKYMLISKLKSELLETPNE
jgi:hypothetical protein